LLSRVLVMTVCLSIRCENHHQIPPKVFRPSVRSLLWRIFF